MTPDFDFAALVRPTPRSARFALPDYHVWCGSLVRGDDGACHLFYSRWPRELGHQAWVTHSEIAHAVGPTPLGPFVHRDVALPARGAGWWDGLCTHNPTIHRFDGRYYLYYMGNTGDGRATHPELNWVHRNHQRVGVAWADSPDGPWHRLDEPVVAPTPGWYDALMTSNPAICRRPDGSLLMVYKAVGDQGEPPFGGPVVHAVASADHPLGPFVKAPEPVFVKAGVHFVAEDPYIWCDGERYWALVKDNAGSFTGAGCSTALFTSADGCHWELARHPLAHSLVLRYDDGTEQTMARLERPQLLLDAHGRPEVLLFAAAAAGEELSWNVQVPLAAGD